MKRKSQTIHYANAACMFKVSFEGQRDGDCGISDIGSIVQSPGFLMSSLLLASY